MENELIQKVIEYKKDINKCIEGGILVDKERLLELLNFLDTIQVTRQLLEVSLEMKRRFISTKIMYIELENANWNFYKSFKKIIR
jgi:hypothetical protein